MEFSIEVEFKNALKYHQSGQLQKVREIYNKILGINPDHGDSLHCLGVIKNRILKGAHILYEDIKSVNELGYFFERVVKEKVNRLE